MGKSKRKKAGRESDVTQPTGLATVKQVVLEVQEKGEDEFLASQIDKLHSTNAEDRECACTALSNSSHGSALRALLAKDTLRHLGALLLDPSVAVARSVTGLLRNVSVDGCYEACDIMTKHDLMTPLLALLKKFAGNEWKVSKPADGKTDMHTETFVNAVQLLQNLCESSDVALKVASHECVVDFLVLRIDPVAYGGTIALAVAECIHVLAEDNPAVRVRLQMEEPSRTLLQAVAATADVAAVACWSDDMSNVPAANDVHLATVAASEVGKDSELLHALVAIAGVVASISGGRVTQLGAGTVHQVLSVLSRALNEECQPLLQLLSEAASCDEVTQPDGKDAVSLDSALRAHESHVRHLLAAQKLAFEILTDILGADGSASGGDDWEDVDMASDDDERLACASEEEDKNGVDDGCHGYEAASDISGCMPLELLAFLIDNGLLSKIVARVQVLPDDLCTRLLECETIDGCQIVKWYNTTVCAALLCLHNVMLAATSADQVGGVEVVSTIWTQLSRLSCLPYVLNNPSLLESVTSALGSVAEKMAEAAAADKLLAVSEADFLALAALATSSAQPQVRANVIHIVSVVGRKLAATPACMPSACHLLVSIGKFLLGVAEADGELWVVAEALDAMFDVFAEDHVDSVLKEIQLVDVLERLAPLLKVKIKQNRKHLSEHLPIITTVQNNLGRFITYKRKHGV